MATFYNQATLSYNGTVASSNITAGEIIEALSVTKTAVSECYAPDSENVFVVSIVNTGSSCYDALTLTDNLGAYNVGECGINVVPLTYKECSIAYYVNGVPQAAPAVICTSPLTVTGISVPAGGNAMLMYSTTVNDYAPLGAQAVIENTATISGTGFEPVTACETICCTEGIDLAISKSLSPAAVEENGCITYTFIIQNFGCTAAVATDNVVFRDTFTPVLTDLTAEFNGVTWVSGINYCYTAADGEFTSNDGMITVPAAEFTQDPATGRWTSQPGVSRLVIRGRLS